MPFRFSDRFGVFVGVYEMGCGDPARIRRFVGDCRRDKLLSGSLLLYCMAFSGVFAFVSVELIFRNRNLEEIESTSRNCQLLGHLAF